MLLTHAAASASPETLAGYMGGGRRSGISLFFSWNACTSALTETFTGPHLQSSALSEIQLLSAGYFLLLFYRDRKIPPKSKGVHLNWVFKLVWICLVKHPPNLIRDSCYPLCRLLLMRVPEQISFSLTLQSAHKHFIMPLPCF